MSEIIESMPACVMGRPLLHDWPEIFDGEARRFGPEEFAGTPSDFGRQVRAAAKRLGVRATVVTRTQPLPAVWVQRVP